MLFIAGLVIGLHTILPHEHHDELDHVEHENLHQEADSLLDYIKLIFHENIGEGHLEHVVVSDIDHLEFDFYDNFILINNAPRILIVQSTQFFSNNNFIYQLGHKQSAKRLAHSRRGPPLIS